jgi:2-oxoisovalerate dehydrogenase E1 component alpha subunit
LGNFLRRHTPMTAEEEVTIRSNEKLAVLKSMGRAERLPPPTIESLFEDVYHQMPPSLLEQQAQLRQHMVKYPKNYK